MIDEGSFLLGFSVGLLAALIASAFGIWIMEKLWKKKGE